MTELRNISSKSNLEREKVKLEEKVMFLCVSNEPLDDVPLFWIYTSVNIVFDLSSLFLFCCHS